MTEQLAFDFVESAGAPSSSAAPGAGEIAGDGNVRRGSPGAQRLLVALVKNGLAEEHLTAAASIALVLDEGAQRD